MMEITFVKVLEYSMIVNGIWKNSNDRSFNWSLILFNFVLVNYSLFACLHFAILNTKNLELFCEAFLFFLIWSFILSYWIILLMNQGQLNNIYNNVEDKFYIYHQAGLNIYHKSKALEKGDKHLGTLLKLIFCTFCITVSASAIIPFSFSRKLLYPLWLPFDINNNFYYLAFAYEMYVCIHGVLLATSVCILYVGLSTFYVTILHLIGETIECIDQLPETKLWHIEQHNKGILIQDTTEHVIKRAVRQHVIMDRYVHCITIINY